MAPCTRRSHALDASGHTQGELSETSGLLQVPTTTSIRGSRHQNGIDVAQHNANPPGKSDISSSYAPLMIISWHETYFSTTRGECSRQSNSDTSGRQPSATYW